MSETRREHDILLNTLAMLQANHDSNSDYISYFEPIVDNAIQKMQSEYIIDVEVASYVLNSYKISIPPGVIRIIVSRLEKKGYVKRENGKFIVANAQRTFDFDKSYRNSKRATDTIVCNIVKYGADELNLSISNEDCEKGLSEFLKQFSVEILSNYYSSKANGFGKSRDTILFIISSYVKYINEIDTYKFNQFVTLVKGYLVSNAILCKDLNRIAKKFQGTTFYIDSSVALSLLGMNGKPEFDFTTELISVLRGLKASVRIFSFTIEEIQRMLEWAANNINDTGRYERIIRTSRELNLTSGDILRKLASVESDLYRARISKLQSPTHIKEFEIDVPGLTERLRTTSKYNSEQAIEHDVEAIRSIYTLRKGKDFSSVEDANAIFLTKSCYLVNEVQKFEKETENNKHLSAVFTDNAISTLAWLKSPLSYENLTKLELITLCASFSEPSDSLMKKFLSTLDKIGATEIITPDMCATIKVLPITREILMSQTHGVEDSLTYESTKTIVNRVIGELKKESNEEIRTIKANFEARISEKDNTIKNKIKNNEAFLSIVEDDARRYNKFIAKISYSAAFISAFTIYALSSFGAGSEYLKGVKVFSTVASAHDINIWINFISSFLGLAMVIPLKRLYSFFFTWFFPRPSAGQHLSPPEG